MRDIVACFGLYLSINRMNSSILHNKWEGETKTQTKTTKTDAHTNNKNTKTKNKKKYSTDSGCVIRYCTVLYCTQVQGRGATMRLLCRRTQPTYPSFLPSFLPSGARVTFVQMRRQPDKCSTKGGNANGMPMECQWNKCSTKGGNQRTSGWCDLLPRLCNYKIINGE